MRFAFSVSSSRSLAGGRRGVCSVVTEVEEDAREDSTTGGGVRMSG